jgi:myo-inositol-1(or 4)-monophosphatase
MDRTLTNHTPDLTNAEPALRERILAGHSAVLSQIEYFRENFGQTESSWKKDGTRVTIVDETISKELFLPLQDAFPHDDYCSEESVETPEPIPLKAEFCWLLDPVDGTNNYAVGITECGISLALLRNGTPIYGFIYDYSRDELLQGGPGLGAIEGTTPVQAATELVNEKLTFCMHFPIPSADLDTLRSKLMEWRIRCPGSAAIGLANVATGRLDGCLEFRPKPWDCAAGYPICEGAGATFGFVREACFPMTSFTPSMPSFPFRAGSKIFMEETSRALGLETT